MFINKHWDVKSNIYENSKAGKGRIPDVVYLRTHKYGGVSYLGEGSGVLWTEKYPTYMKYGAPGTLFRTTYMSSCNYISYNFVN